MKPLIAFRTGASPTIGGGHVMRCLTLADQLRGRGCDVLFLVKPGSADVVPALARSGHAVTEVDDRQDACAALQRLGTARAHVAVVDSYELGLEHERALRACADHVAVVDDYNTRAHDCDLLLDQTFGRTPEDFAAVVPPHARVLAGSHYVLMRPEFARSRDVALARRSEGGPARRILISLGLTDLGGLSVPIAAALAGRLPGVAIDVIFGTKTPTLAEAQHLAETQPAVQIHIDPPSVAALLTEADLAVGAAGASTWERCCLGLPSVMVVLADNQRQIAANVRGAGAAATVDSTGPEAIAAAATALAKDAPRRRRMAQAAAAICDGLGTVRVADAILDLVAATRRIG